MWSKKFIVGGFTGGFIYFLLGWLVYSAFLNDIMEKHPGLNVEALRYESSFLPILLGKLLLGFLLTYLLISTKTYNIIRGAKKGAFLGLLISSANNFVLYGTTTIYSKTFILVDILAFTFISAVVAYAIIIIADLDDKILESPIKKSRRSK
jgi:hypothetical protein